MDAWRPEVPKKRAVLIIIVFSGSAAEFCGASYRSLVQVAVCSEAL